MSMSILPDKSHVLIPPFEFQSLIRVNFYSLSVIKKLTCEALETAFLLMIALGEVYEFIRYY